MSPAKKKGDAVDEEASTEPSSGSDFDSDFNSEGASEGDDTLSESGSEMTEFSDDEEIASGSSEDDAATNSDVDGSNRLEGPSGSDEELSQGEQASDGNEDAENGSDDEHQGVEESDSSEDEVPDRNTIGDVPLEWYKDESHIGYDRDGKKIIKRDRHDKLDSYPASADDKTNWRKIYDEFNDEEVNIGKRELKLIRKLMKGQAPHDDFDPHAPFVDWFTWEDAKHPLSSAPEPKRRFIPSKWESKKVVAYVRAIRKGLIKFDKPKEEPRFYNLWGDGPAENTGGLAYIPAPKPKLPGHEESYNPSLEYIPSQEEINSYQLMFEEDRPKYIPER